MALRFKVFVLPAIAIAAAAALVVTGSQQYVRRQFQQAGEERTRTLVAQFQNELQQRGDEIARAVQSVADSEATLRMALDLTRPQSDPSIYVNDARGLASLNHLDYLNLVTAEGGLISSTHWAPVSGYHNDWVTARSDWSDQSAFLSRVELPASTELGLLAVRTVRVGDRNLYVIGGRRFDAAFLRTAAVPEDMQVLLYASLEPGFAPEDVSSAEGTVAQPEEFAPLIELLLRGGSEQQGTVRSFDRGGGNEDFVAVPLKGRGGETLAALLAGNSRRDLAAVVSYIRSLGLLAAGLGVLFSLALSWRVSARVSRPLAQLAAAAKDLQSGKWTLPAAPAGDGEIGRLAAALGQLSEHVSRERERAVQRERVAARREMARRFARDLKESIFPLHMAAEDLVHAREETSERFDEIFFECATSIRGELDRLTHIAARFGEFGRMPRPRPVPVSVNEIARLSLHAVQSHFDAAGRPPVTPEVRLGEPEPVIEADPDMLRAALENLLLHCLDAMSSGGTLTIRTRENDSVARIEISARGASLSPEDCQRLFVPAGPAPDDMTGLGLATAHAVVSDHGGKISAESAGDGAVTLRLEFPALAGGKSRLAAATELRGRAQLTTGEKPLRALPPAPATTPALEPAANTAAPAVPVAIVEVVQPADAEAPAVGETSRSADIPSDTTRAFRGLTYTA